MDTETGEMIVKRVSVPIGLEEMMEGLVKEVLLKKPDDIYFFAAKYFARLLLLRDKGQNKVTTIRSAQSLTDQREKRPPTKIPVVGVTKQLSRQFSVRGESPARNFDSPIISQKPKMYDRNESKYKRRNTGPTTIPENHINTAIRKKYSRSVSTERKKEIVDTNSNIPKNPIRKRSITRKENKEVPDESNQNHNKNKNGGKQNNVSKELQQHSRLTKNIPITGVATRKFSEEKKISKKDETAAVTKSIMETGHDMNESIQGRNESSHAETKITRQSTHSTHGNVDHQPVETITSGESIGQTDILHNSAEKITDKVSTNENNIEETTESDENVERKFDNLPEIEEKNTTEIIEGDSKTNDSSEKCKSPSGTLDDLTMESENGEKGFDEHSCPISEKINETVKDSMGNLETVEEVNHTLAEFNEDIAHESKKPLEDDVTVVREKRNTSDLVNDKEVDTGLSDRELDKDGFNRDMELQENTTEKLLNFDESKIENSNKKIEQGDDSDKIIDEESQIENIVDEGSSFHEIASPVSDKKIDEKKTNDGLIDSEVMENELDHSMKDVSDREKSALVEKSDVSEKLDESEVSTRGTIDSVCGNEVIGGLGTDEVDAEKKGKMDGDITIDGETSATNKSKEDVTDVLGRSQKDEDDSHNDSSRIITGENPIGDSEKEENAQSDQFSQFEKNKAEESPEETIEKREVTGNATDIGGRNTQFEVSNDPLLETASPECEINEEDKHGKKHNISDTSTGQKQLSSMSSDKNKSISEDDFTEKKEIVENDTSNGSETILDPQKIPVKNDDGKIEKSNGLISID
nr:uncharacterized protein LOC111509486 [Leptinotarsa decemlineata]